MRIVTLASRPTPGHWLDAADVAIRDAERFRQCGNHALATCRIEDAAFCHYQAKAMMLRMRQGDAA